ncbi:unnamed protein product [Arctia plantaginis]|uniref:Secreted protein n=1 Tax=Arctia plantaginis TaxID=874455 RepID=A0A8S1AWN3_ARCPL|nr:unnamed protein product [Arctia plantaginis]
MGLKWLVIVVLLVCETISSNYLETDDDDGTPDMTEGSGDSDVPDDPPFPFPEHPKGRILDPRITICYRSRHGFDPNITAEQLNAEPALAICNKSVSK